MARTLQEIIDHGDEIAARFENDEPGVKQDVAALHAVRDAAEARSAVEAQVRDAVVAARAKGCSWAAIGMMLGTSGEAARQRYSNEMHYA